MVVLSERQISNLIVYETPWGALIPKPILDYLLFKGVPIKYIISIADKVRNYEWLTRSGKLHRDSFNYICDKSSVTKTWYTIIETNKYKFIISEFGKFLLVSRRRPDGLFEKTIEYKLDDKAVKMLIALIKINEVLRNREINKIRN